MSYTAEQKALLRAVGALLTTRAPWTLEPEPLSQDEDRFQLQAGPAGPSLWFRFDAFGNKGKVSVHGNWPMDPTQGRSSFPREQPPSVNISHSKTPKQIAAEIERRFLPAYLKAWDSECKLVAERMDYARRQKASIERVVAETGARPLKAKWDGQYHIDWDTGSFDKGYLTNVQVSADTMQFEVRSVPVAVGIEMINLLFKQNRKG